MAEIRQVESSLNLDLNLPHSLAACCTTELGIVPTLLDEEGSAEGWGRLNFLPGRSWEVQTEWCGE